MKVIITAVCILLALVGCEVQQEPPKPIQFETICLDGVEYWITRTSFGYAGYGYMSVKFNPDGKVVPCDVMVRSE